MAETPEDPVSARSLLCRVLDELVELDVAVHEASEGTALVPQTVRRCLQGAGRAPCGEAG